jgi:Concanavalin A-like lectin/glucanases superfamily
MSFTLSDGGIQITNTTFLGPTPGAPSITAVTQTGRGEVRIDYTAPVYKGSSVITQYIAVSSPDNLIGTLFTFASGSITISGLTTRQTYLFVVYAVNSFGSGATSLSNPIFIYPPEPDEPTGINVSQLGWGANISYSAPLRIGLSAISSYTGISTPGSLTKIGTQADRSLIIGDNTTKLSLGTPYTFTVHATNSWGDSPESAPGSLTLTRPTPDAPGLSNPFQQDAQTIFLTMTPPTLTAVQPTPTTYSLTYSGITKTAALSTLTASAGLLACRTDTLTAIYTAPNTLAVTYTLTSGGTPTVTTVTSIVTSTTSPFPNAISSIFTGANYLTGPANLRLITTGTFSIEFWIQPDVIVGTDRCIFENFAWNAGNNSGFRVYLTTDGKIRLDVSDGNYGATTTQPPAILTTNAILATPLPSYALYFTSSPQNFIEGPQNIPFLTTGTFTIEAWVKVMATPTTDWYTIIENSHWDNANCGGFRLYVTNTLIVQFRWQNGTNGVGAGSYPGYTNWNIITTTTAIVIGNYTHIAVVRDSTNTVRVYFNGVDAGGSVVNATSLSTVAVNNGASPGGIGTLRIARNVTDSVNKSNFLGYISNVRIVPSAVYTGSFTPPVGPLSVTQSAGSAGSNIASIGPVIPNNGYSVYFPNATLSYASYLSITGAQLSSLALGSASWTVEGWIYPSSQPSQNIIMDWRTADNTNNNMPVLYLLNGNLTWRVNASGRVSSGTITQHVWTHFAVVKNNATTSLYINGQSVSSFNDTITYAIGLFQIGKAVDANYFHGHMSNIRIVKGVAVYTGPFTVPTGPLALTQNAGTNINAITGTQCVLLTCQNTDAGTTYTNILDVVSNTFLSSFKGNGYIAPTLTKHYSPFGNQAALLMAQNSTSLTSGYDNSGFGYSGQDNAVANIVGLQLNWYHVAISRDPNNVIRIFVNGVADTNTVTYSKSFYLRGSSTTPGKIYSATSVLNIGRTGSDSVPGNIFPYSGKICDLRVIQSGYYRSANFSVPTGLLPSTEVLYNAFYINQIAVNGDKTLSAYSTNIYGDGPTGTALIVPYQVGQVAWAHTNGQNGQSDLTFTWTVPAGVTCISAVAIGGGGGRGYLSATQGGGGGGGGGLSYINSATVTPGEVLSIRVGVAGYSATSGNGARNGGTSSITRANGLVMISATGGLTTYGVVTGGTGGIGLTGLNTEGETVVGFNGRQGSNGSGATYGQGGSAATYTATPTTYMTPVSELGSAWPNGLAGNGGNNTPGSVSPVGYGVVRIVWPGEFRKYPNTNVINDL